MANRHYLLLDTSEDIAENALKMIHYGLINANNFKAASINNVMLEKDVF